MEILLLILFVISIPIFYILGAIDFFKTVFGKKNKQSSLNRSQFLKLTHQELEKFLKTHPRAKASEFLEYLKLEQKSLGLETTIVEEEKKYEDRIIEDKVVHHSEVFISGDVETEKIEEERHHKKVDKNLWENWYNENSINLLLYIGAFFIVSSASIFVGFQWESIGQELKALLLTLLTLAFLGSGFFFFQNQKVKNAGLTFSAIGSLLIPLTGVGWYNFVLKEQGISFGLTWFITSIIALGIYITLGLFFKSKFYGYITSLALWSLSLSFVALSNLDGKFYILASILSNFFILWFHLVTKAKNENIQKVFAEPLEISTNILMPATLFFGLALSFSDSMFYSIEVAISLFLASCYYYLYYSFTQKLWQLAVSETIFPFFLLSIFGWKNATDYRLFYTEIILGTADVGISYVMLKNKLEKPALVSTAIGTIIVVLSFISILGAGYGAMHSLSASILLLMFGALAFFVHKKYELLHISSIALLFTVYFLFKEIIGLQDKEYLLGILYLIMGGASFVATWLLKDNNKPQMLVLLVLSALSLALGFIFSISNEYAVLLSLITYSVIFFASSIRFKNTDLIFLSNLFLSLSLYQIIHIFEIDLVYQPFIFITLAIGLYSVSSLFSSDENRQNRYKFSGLIVSILTPLFYGTYSGFNGAELERSALISAYLSTVLFGFEASRTKNEQFRYFTSAVAIITILWQIKFLQFTELQMYAIPLGIYFLLLGFSRKLKDDKSGEELLNVIGIATLLLTSISQAFGESSAVYALVLGIEGILFILLGISTNNKLFRYAGIAAIVLAVISQTYSYLFSLPRWLITGLAGIIFLAVAVFLLIKRKPEDDSSKD